MTSYSLHAPWQWYEAPLLCDVFEVAFHTEHNLLDLLETRVSRRFQSKAELCVPMRYLLSLWRNKFLALMQIS